MNRNVCILIAVLALSLVATACSEEQTRDSAQCKVTSSAEGSVITCGDGAPVTVLNGKDGKNGVGEQGAPGEPGAQGPSGGGALSGCVLSQDLGSSTDFPSSPYFGAITEQGCTIVVGNVYIDGMEMPQEFAHITHIYGDLTIGGASTGGRENSGTFSELVHVAGIVELSRTNKMDAAPFPKLATIGGLEVGETDLTNLNLFAAVTSVKGNIIITENDNLANVDGLFDGMTHLKAQMVTVDASGSGFKPCELKDKILAIPGGVDELNITGSEQCP